MINILFEDDFIILVDKPAKVLSQPSIDKKRIPIKEQLETERPDLIDRLFLHHRLDYETSGIFLMSKNKSVNKALTDMFTHHNFKKKYHCLTKPHDLKPAKKVECESINESNWKIKNFMAPAFGLANNKKRMISVKTGKWAAETEFKIINKTSDFYYTEAIPKTGRTHQIRLHLQESCRSILGDSIYGGQSETVSRLMLHALSLEFIHPKLNTSLKIEAPLPQDFLNILENIDEHKI